MCDKPDPRIIQLQQWLEQHFSRLAYFQAASADASFRRYFRLAFDENVKKLNIESAEYENVESGKSYIVMDAPPDKEDISAFIVIGRLLEQYQLHVPHIMAFDQKQGFMLLTDLGKSCYLDILNQNNVDTLYADAMDVLLRFYDIDAELKLPLYDAALLKKEMALFEQWYVNVHLGITLTPVEKKVLDSAMALLLQSALEQPRVFVHRDYHSRNLLKTDTNNPGIIDFQDAVWGPCTYDLVSLLNDSYICWPKEKVYRWVGVFHQQLVEKGRLDCPQQQFYQWFDWMAMQRQLKVLGIFARLYHRDGKQNYLRDMPLTYANLLFHCRQYTQFCDLADLLLRLAPET